MKLAICQINPSIGDFDKNKIKILEYVEKSKLLNANIIVFPELSLCGYPPMDLIWDKEFNTQINVVMGDEWIAGNLSYHLNSRPEWDGFLDEKKLKTYKNFMCIDKVCIGTK